MAQHWFADLYASIDAMNLDAFAAGLTPDAEVIVGNNPPMSGRQAAKEGIGGFFSTIAGIRHNVTKVVESGGVTVMEARVDYTRRDGQTVTVPAVTILERRGDLVKSLRIYVDVAPVYA